MALTFTLNSHSYQGRYLCLTCLQTRDLEANASKIDWTLTATGGTSPYYTTGPTTVMIGGVQVYYKVKTAYTTHEFPAAVGSVSGTLTVQHDENGNASIPVSIRTAIYNGVLTTSSGTWELDANERFAYLISAPDFHDEEDPVITYSNPAGSKVTSLQACISLDGANDDIAYRDLNPAGSSYTFSLTDAERDVLRAETTGSNVRTVQFLVRTVMGESTGLSNLPRNLTIKDPNPTLSPTIVDSNSTTVALTGSSSKLVRYYSNAKVSFGAAAVKKATIAGKKVTCGGKSLETDGTINAVESNSFVFTVTDSRGNTVTKILTPSFIEYIKLTCNLENEIPDGEGAMTLKAFGSYYGGSFGAEDNHVKVYYRYKAVGGNYGDWVEMAATPGDNTYNATAAVTVPDYRAAYVFQVKAVDALSEAYSAERTVKATPVFDWSESDFQFHVPVAAEKISGLALPAGNSDAASKQYVDSLVLDKIYPINSIYISYSHTSPASLFGGTWTRIGSRFLLAAEAGDAIGEVGGEEEVALTQAQLPNHSHGSVYTGDPDSKSFTFKWLAPGAGTNLGYDTVTTGGGAAHNNMPPYVKVSIWRRKA